MGDDRPATAPGTIQGQAATRPPNFPRIFINYRRQDTAGHAGRLYDSLEDQLGKGHVFMDIDAIAPGTDYERVIEQSLGKCDVVLIVIGKEWLKGARFGGARLNQRGDFVRLEIEGAMRRKVPVIPVLVQGAPMPTDTNLPVTIKGLTRRNAIELSDARWRFDVEKLIHAVETLPPDDPAVADVDDSRGHEIRTQYSDDGKFFWDGFQWVPVKQTTARFWPRLGAFVIDLFIVTIVLGLVVDAISNVLDPSLTGLPTVAAWLLIPVSYFAAFWVLLGRTPGMMLFRLSVIRADGSQLKWGRATWRAIMLLVSLIGLYYIAWIFVATDRRKQALHDRLAGTIVVKASRKS